MQKTRVDSLLRLVWLINGLVLLALLAGAAVFLLVGAFSQLGGGDAGAPSTHAEERASHEAPLRYDPPEAIRGTSTRIVVIRRGNGYTYRNTSSSARPVDAPAVNVAFLDAQGAWLLLDRPAYLAHVRYPGERGPVTRDDSLRWIVYEAALEDTNGDRKIDDRDRRSLYVTGLDGRGWRRVLPDGFELRDWAGQPDGSLAATAVQLRAGGESMPERSFVLEPSGTVRPYAALDSVVTVAERIIDKP